MSFEHKFAHRTQRMRPVAIREISKATNSPGFITFTAGKPAPDMFPLGQIAEMSGHVIEKYGASALQYSASEGYQPLREQLASRSNAPVTDADVIIISGSQQAIDLMGKVFLDPGDKVVVSSPTYMGAISALNVYEPEFLPVACDQDGMLPDSLEKALQQNPKFIYCTANFSNPTGVDMSLERRQALVDLARQYEVPILEDDPYGQLRFEGNRLPTLFELAPEQVIYAGSFSKVLAPGLRIGWITAKSDALRHLTTAKQAGDLQTAIFIQLLVYELMLDGTIDAQIGRTRTFYKQQRQYMVDAIKQYFPPEINVNFPKGGMFLWAELPAGLDATELLLGPIMAERVAYIPGSTFHAEGGHHNTLRLSFSIATQDEIERGVQIMGRIFGEAIAAHSAENTTRIAMK